MSHHTGCHAALNAYRRVEVGFTAFVSGPVLPAGPRPFADEKDWSCEGEALKSRVIRPMVSAQDCSAAVIQQRHSATRTYAAHGMRLNAPRADWANYRK